MKAASSIYLISLQSDKSRVVMSSYLNRWASILQSKDNHEDLDWSKITYTDILEGVNTLKGEGKAPSTVNTYIASIKGVSKEAWRNEDLTTRQYQSIKDLKRIKGNRGTKGVLLSKSDLKKLITACVDDNTVIGMRDSAIIALSYGGGLRRSETASLDMDDYNSVNETISILGKGNKLKTNTLNSSTVKIVNDYLKVRGNAKGNLFLRGRKGDKLVNTGITDQSIYNMVVARCEKAGLGKVSPHSLRKSFVTHLLENGEDLFTVCELARHASVDTTKMYDLRGDHVKVNAAKSLGF